MQTSTGAPCALPSIATVIFAALATFPGVASACSICRCGDPTYNALGLEGVADTGLRVALDWDQVRKSQGPADARDSVVERRETLLLAYGINDRLSVFARVGRADRKLSEAGEDGIETSQVAGLADPEFSAQLRVWSSDFQGNLGRRSSIYLTAGVKTDWGKGDASRDGERLDQHVQPGTGAVDQFVGVSASYQIDADSAVFGSAQHRFTGRNDVGYQYGSSTLVNLAYDRKLGPRLDGVLELNYRHAAIDEEDAAGTTDENSGGHLMYLTPRLLYSVGGGWVVRAAAQIPLGQGGLNGLQHEQAVVNLGITYQPGR